MTYPAAQRTSIVAAGLFVVVIAILISPMAGWVARALSTGGPLPPDVYIDTVSDSVGAIAAEFRVDESGAATYSIPLYAVPGTAGVAPSLSLSYSSQGGEGPMGKGWSVGGLSTITRCRSSRETGDFIVGGVATDGTSTPVNFTTSDRYCLDGQKLLPASDTCGAAGGYAGTSMRTEVDTFQRICAYGPSPQNMRFFIVQRKDGSVNWYGDRDVVASANRPDGIFESTSPGFEAYGLVWAQTRMQDSAGNTIDYVWAAGDTGENVIKEVRWTGKVPPVGGTGISAAPFTKIIFNYSVRVVADATLGFVSGGVVKQTRRLDSITSCGAIAAGCATSEQVRFYQLTYAKSVSNSGADTLTSVQECRDSTRAVCVKPTTFTWSNAVNALATSAGWNPGVFGSSTKFEGFKLGDVDGDGRVDMVWLKDGSSGETCPTEHILVSFGTRDGTGRQTFRPGVLAGCTPTEVMTGLGEASWQLFDYNGDGRDDMFVAGAYGTKYYLYPSQGDVAQPFNTGVDLLAAIPIPMLHQGTTYGNTSHPQLTDLNGDGLMDVLYKNTGTPMYRVRLMERQADDSWKWGNERGVVMNISPAPACPPEAVGGTCAIGAGQPWNPDLMRLVDFDGDAASDLMFTQSVSYTIDDSGCVGGPKEGCSDRETVQYLHAGRVSSITPTTVYFTNISSATILPGRHATQPMPLFGDTNGDGLTDIVYRKWDGSYVYTLNTGRGFLAAVDIGPVAIPELTKLVDVNGDGRSDFVFVQQATGANPMHYWYRPALRGGGFGQPGEIPGAQAFACLGFPCDPKMYASMFTDLDADGGLDYFAIQMGVDNPAFYLSQAAAPSVGKPRDVITSILNGLGSRTDLQYAALTNARVHVRRANSRSLDWGRGAPVMDFMAPSYVVAKASSSSPQPGAPAAMASVHYRYVGARVQSGGRGFLGFEQVFSIDANSPNGVVATQTNYRQDFPFTGMPSVTMKSVGAAGAANSIIADACITAPYNNICYATPGAALPTFASSWFSYNQQFYEADTDSTGTSLVAFAPGVRAPIHVRTLNTNESLRDPYAAAITGRVGTNFYYGANGNVTETRAYTYTTLNGAETLTSSVTTVNGYTDNLSKWWLGRLTSSTVTHARPSLPNVVRTTGFAYDATNGMLTAERAQANATADLDLRKQRTLDIYGNTTVSMTCAKPSLNCDTAITFHPADPQTVERYTKTAYDAIGRFPVTTTEPFWNGTGTTEVTTQTVIARNLFGNVVHSRDANGADTTAQYGTLGRPYYTWTETAAGGTPNIGGATSVTTYRWCGSGTNLVTCPDGASYRQKVTSSVGPDSWSYLDALGRVVLTATETFNAGATGKEVTAACTGYEASGKPSRASNPFFLANTAAAMDTAALSTVCLAAARQWTTTTYDALGRPLVTTAPDGTHVDKEYWAGWTTTTDARGNPTVELRNGKGELVKVTDANNSSALYYYYADGSLSNINRWSGRASAIVNSFTYDALGRKVSQNDPDAGITYYGYNAVGELISQWDPNGDRIDFSIDARGRTWQKTVKRGSDGLVESQVTTEYDTAPGGLGKATTERITGQYIGWSGQTGTELDFERDYGYDAMGRLDASITTIDGVGYASAIVYDSKGRPFRAQDASGRWTKTEWSPNGFSAAVCESSATDTLADCGNTYWQRTGETDAWGHVILESRGTNGVMQLARTYDDITGRVERLCAGAPGACGLMDEQYAWDAAGNLHSHLKEARYFESTSYDALNRLLQTKASNGTLVQGYTYDALGNICRRQEYGATYDYVYSGRAGCGLPGLPGGGSESPIGPTQLVQVGVTYMSYDDHGNQVGRTRSDTPGTWKDRGIKYSLDDRAYEISLGMFNGPSPLQRTRFWYGADGARYKREDGGKTTLYVGNVEIISLSGVTTFRRYIGDVAIQDVVNNVGTDRYVFKDQLGSLVKIASATGAPLQTRDFDAFGERRNPTNPWQTGAIPSPDYTTRGFSGHEQIDGAYPTYVVHMGGRIYDSSSGQFLQPDPVVQAPNNIQSWNAYTYVFNNPLTYTDPTGLWGVKEQNTLRMVVAIVISIWTGGAAAAALGPTGAGMSAAFGIAMAGGFAAGMIASNGSMRAGLIGAFTAGLTMGIGGITDPYLQFAARAVSGGIIEMLQGGNFGHGFAAAGLTALVMPQVGKMTNDVARTAVGAIVGGTISEVTGGKFANGAVSGAIQGAMAKSGGWEEGEWTAEDQAAMDASKNAYVEEGKGFAEVGVEYRSSDGFAANLTRPDPDGPYVLAFRGSEGAWNNWKNNFKQALGLRSSQYDQAQGLARDVFDATHGNVIFVGHSLGGGLAGAAAYATGGRAITFNAAGLSARYRAPRPVDIRAHSIRGDILTTFQALTPFPNAAGTQIYHSGSGNPFGRHLKEQFR